MIVRIMDSAPSAWFSLQYNEDKVQQGVADICAVGNIQSCEYKDVWEAIVGREKKIGKTEKPSLHIVFSPGEDDEMPTDKMVDFIKDWLKEVGLDGQPYAVYRHRDIARIHYHLVSTKLREDGKSVKANNLSYKSRDAMKKLEKEYTFYYGKNREGQKAMSRQDRDRILKEKGFDPFRFDPSKSHVWEQIGLIYESVKRDFTFRSDNEFRTIMDACGLVTKIAPSAYDGKYLAVHYKDAKGHKTGKPRIYNNMEYRMLHSLVKEAYKPTTRRVKAEVKKALLKAGSIREFRIVLNEKKITPRCFINKKGQYQGVSFVDFHDFQVVKASELGELSHIIRAAFERGLEEARRQLLAQEKSEKEAADKKASAEQAVQDQETRIRQTPSGAHQDGLREFLGEDYLSAKDASAIAIKTNSNPIFLDALTEAFPGSSILLHDAITISGHGVTTVAYASIDNCRKTVILKKYRAVAVTDGFVKMTVSFKAGESIPRNPTSSISVTYGLFRLINALSHLGGTGGHQASSSSLSKNGKGLWDDSLDAADEEERQKKNQNSIRM